VAHRVRLGENEAVDLQALPRRGALLAALPLLAVAAAACAPPPVTYRLRFPSEETFLLSSTARVDVYDGSGEVGPDAICRALSVGQPAPVSAIQTTGKRGVCEFFGPPGIVMKDVDVGRLVLFAEAEGADATKLLRGCAVVDVLPATNAVEIQLSTLPSYPDDAALPCSNVQAKCGSQDC
jgi:hypothetical protein